MNIWQKVRGVVTPGGDPCWECPVCGEGSHVMGIETLYNFTNVCRDCGAEVYYDYQTFTETCEGCVSYNKENDHCIITGRNVKNERKCPYYETFA